MVTSVLGTNVFSVSLLVLTLLGQKGFSVSLSVLSPFFIEALYSWRHIFSLLFFLSGSRLVFAR